jgi:arylsulfatase A-like enzyme
MPYASPADVAARFVRGSPTSAEMEEAHHFIYPHTIAYDLRLEQVSDAQRDLLSDLYDGEIASLDSEIGRLLDTLRDDGVLDSTLVIIAGDHGENLGDHHMFEHSLGLHRTLCQVPLLVRYPGAFDKGRVVSDVVRLEDLYPTTLETCGLPVTPGLDGVSLSHDLPGRIARAMQSPLIQQRPVLADLFGAPAGLARLLQGVDSVYDGRFHFIRYADGAEELYDVARDPGETDRGAAWDPVVAARLRALLATHESPAAGERAHATVK